MAGQTQNASLPDVWPAEDLENYVPFPLRDAAAPTYRWIPCGPRAFRPPSPWLGVHKAHEGKLTGTRPVIALLGCTEAEPARNGPNVQNCLSKKTAEPKTLLACHGVKCYQKSDLGPVPPSSCPIIPLHYPLKIMSSHSHGGKIEPKFSVALFAITILVTLAGLFGVLALAAPGVWKAQLASGWGALAVVFLVVHLVAAFVEFIFHRYVLHAPLVPFLSYFYKQHTLHHALTRIGYQRSRDGKEEIPRLVESVAVNRYPIIDEPQYEASYFPWYTLAVFALLASVVFVPLQWLLPDAPVFLGGFLAIAWSLMLYELIHAIEHWPQAIWDRLIEHPTFGRVWRKAYAFHLRHHADIRCNEAISGFFALPLVDFVLGTYVDPETLYTHGRPVDPKEFVSPQPRFALIRWLDRQADQSVKRRRQRRAAEVSVAPEEEALPPVVPKFATIAEGRARS